MSLLFYGCLSLEGHDSVVRPLPLQFRDGFAIADVARSGYEAQSFAPSTGQGRYPRRYRVSFELSPEVTDINNERKNKIQLHEAWRTATESTVAPCGSIAPLVNIETLAFAFVPSLELFVVCMMLNQCLSIYLHC
jgi:hypothetical protein